VLAEKFILHRASFRRSHNDSNGRAAQCSTRAERRY
jgi:hypothetical protein